MHSTCLSTWLPSKGTSQTRAESYMLKHSPHGRHMDRCHGAKVYKETTEEVYCYSSRTHPVVIRELK